MNVRSVAGWVVGGLLVLVFVSLVAGGVLGQPVLFAYVETGSMEPTLNAGDGFVAIPAAITGPAEPGDVVVFNAEHIHDGGLVTHRVLGEQAGGYVTRGDANPTTDQDGQEPPVADQQIVAHALQIDDHVVRIPHLGTAVMTTQAALESTQRTLSSVLGTQAVLGTQGLAYLVFAVSLLLYVLSVVQKSETRRHRRRSRDRDAGVDVRVIVLALTMFVVVGLTLAMVGPSGSQQVEVTSTTFDSEHPEVLQQGTSENFSYVVPNGGVLPTVSYVSTSDEHLTVMPSTVHTSPRSERNVTVTLTAPEEPGRYRMFLTEHRYVAVLPSSVLFPLYETHPWLPIVAINAMLGIPIYLLGTVLLGRGSIRDRRWKRTGGGWSRSS